MDLHNLERGSLNTRLILNSALQRELLFHVLGSLFSPRKRKNFLNPYLIQEMSRERSTHQLVLIGSDCRKDCLREDERPEFFRLQIEQRGRVVFLFNDVHPRLVLMHRVQNDLQQRHGEH